MERNFYLEHEDVILSLDAEKYRRYYGREMDGSARLTAFVRNSVTYRSKNVFDRFIPCIKERSDSAYWNRVASAFAEAQAKRLDSLMRREFLTYLENREEKGE